jgi:plastocyanin
MRRARWISAFTAAVIAATILFVPHAGAGGGGCHPDPTENPTVARVRSGEAGTAVVGLCAFQPTVLYVDEGTEVTWVNKDAFDHTVTGAYLQWGSERFLGQGDRLTERFDESGVFPFYCLLHPGMVGTGVVGDPDPQNVTTELSTFGGAGMVGGDGTGGPAEVAPGVTDEPASDSLLSAGLLATVVGLALALAVAFTFVRRRNQGSPRSAL